MYLLNTPRKPSWPYVLNQESDQSVGLIGWWPGGPVGGLKLFDQSIKKSRHGTLTNFASPFTATSGWIRGQDGGGRCALYFDGTNDQVTISSYALTTLHSLSFWMTKVGAGDAILLGEITGEGYAPYVDSTKFYYRASTSGEVSVSHGGVSGTILVTITRSGTSVAFYKNGAQISTTQTMAANNNLSITTFGARGSGSVFLAGAMEDIRFYNRALNATEVAALYNPTTRWQLRYQPNRTKWFLGASPGISFDAASNSTYQAAASTYSWSHTCTGSNRFLSVDISLLSAGSTVTSITYNGVALSLIQAQSTVTSFGRVECWGLIAPASGSNTIAVTLSGSIVSAGSAVSYTGVHQTSPTEGGAGNQATNVGATDATVAITSVADQDWIHAAIATDDGSVTAGQTSRNNVTGVGGSGADEDFGPQTAGAKTMSYTGVGALATWAIAGYAIRPISASSLGGTIFRVPNLDGIGVGGKFFANPLA